MNRSVSKLIKSLAIGIVFFNANGCSQKESSSKIDSRTSSRAITELDKRISKLESQLGKNINKHKASQSKAPAGPITSMTFRLGTKDDRLRIYWADGSSSDLPCTKEQSIWVCG